MTAKRFAVLVNGSGGSANDARIEEVVVALDAAGLDHRLYRTEGDPTDEAHKALKDGADVLVAGGGDGTVGTIAGVAVEANVPLGLLPFGTLNHFARDLGVPGDVEGAVGVLAAGTVRNVDVGCIDDVVFVNNASVGTYARLVSHRESLEGRMGKVRGGIAAVRAVFPYRPAPIELTVDGERIALDATLVFFGNNDYVVEGGRFTRERIDGGVLSVYAMKAEHTWDLVRIAFRIARDNIDREPALVHRTGTTVKLSARRSSTLLAHDGEVTDQAMPFVVTVRPGALQVFAP